ncbi:MAG: hypothetical protein II357_00785 [Clostridia bacterium]|nr:hypothetical protein [Clostridia bacterium]
MNISEKVAYIKGLAEGLSLDETTKEGKLIAAIIDILDDVAVEIDDIEETVADMADQIDAVDEDLSSIEELIYDEDDDEDGCCCCGDEDDDEVYEVVCPACNDVIYLDAEMLADEGIDCPNCGTALEFDFDCCDDDCCCGCHDEEDGE